MSKILKQAAVFSAIILSGIIGLVGFYSKSLPDSYRISEGEKLMINSLFSISAKPIDEKITAAVTTGSGVFTHKSKSALMLFGAVPIKEVESETVKRPNLIPCGQAFGIKLITDGVMVVDLQQIDKTCPAKACGIREGDVIVSINGGKVKSNADVSKIISDTKGDKCKVAIRRNGEDLTFDLTPEYCDGSYKAGMWVRDSSAGIGTLTFYDPETGCFGGLGHPICDSDTKKALPLSEGSVGEVKITGFNKSTEGNPGQLLGEFVNSASTGNILANCDCGVFGTLNSCPSKNTKSLPLGFRQEISTGKAKILSTVNGGEPLEYDISIEQISLNGKASHDLVVKVTDKRLLESTGGIVQGMSGSPIIQNGKIVGAVTHVFIDDPSMGYGIFADSMYSKSSEAYENSLKKAG